MKNELNEKNHCMSNNTDSVTYWKPTQKRDLAFKVHSLLGKPGM